MSCEHCQDHLLDLVYGEADRKDEAALRAHMDGCASCQASFDQLGMARSLAGELAIEEPSPFATDAILAAARAHVGAAEAQVEPGEASLRQEPEEDEGLWAAIVRWAGSFAMGPQVAMATIMLLVVSTGLWYFPNRRRPPEATGSTVMSPDLGGEAGPTGSLMPAQPLDIALDERAGRIRARGDMPDRARRSSIGGGGNADAPGQFAEGSAAGPVIAARDSRGGAAADNESHNGLEDGLRERLEAPREEQGQGGLVIAAELDEGYGAAAPARQQAPAAPADLDSDSVVARAMGGASGDDALGSMSAGAGRPASRRMAQTLSRPETTAGSTSPSAAAAPSPSPPPASNAGVPAGAAPAEPAPADAREAYARGMQRFQSGNYWGAAEDFNRVYRQPDGQEGLVPSALHHMARSHRRASSCRTAVTHYSSLLQRYPSYSGAPRALIELADCYRTLGRLSDARTTLERAQRHASVASEARRELLRVDQMQRAQRRMGDETPAAAAAEAAY